MLVHIQPRCGTSVSKLQTLGSAALFLSERVVQRCTTLCVLAYICIFTRRVLTDTMESYYSFKQRSGKIG